METKKNKINISNLIKKIYKKKKMNFSNKILNNNTELLNILSLTDLSKITKN